MSWTDQQSVNVIKYLRDIFKVKIFCETGAFKGINAVLQSNNFDEVYTCEKIKKYHSLSAKRIEKNWFKGNHIPIYIYNEDSKEFLKWFVNYYKVFEVEKNTVIFYLDAHFYDQFLPKNKRFAVIDELKALRNFKNCIIVIHDFDNNLGHITYDEQPLNLELIKKDLFKINKKFNLYTNTLEGCNPVKLTRHYIEKAGLNYDKETIDNLKYMWSNPRLTYRGILYALPTKLTDKELKALGLRKWS